MTMVKITPTDNCPYLIEGPARVVGARLSRRRRRKRLRPHRPDHDLPLPLRRLRNETVLRRTTKR
jgi:hypothetical protein